VIPSGLGFYIWKLGKVIPLEKLVATLKAVNARWVCIKLVNGSYRYNQIDETGTMVGNDDFLIEVIATLRQEIPGILIGGWAWILTREIVLMISQASLAGGRCATLGLDFWFIDAEENADDEIKAYWKTSPWRSLSAREYLDFGPSMGMQTPALSSYRFPESHPEFPWGPFLQHEAMKFTAPQVYWIGAHNPAFQLAKTIEQYAGIRELPMVPIGAAFHEGGWTTTPADIAEFTQAVQDEGLTGWGWWVLDQAINREDWLEAMATDYTPPPTPEPEPETIPDLVEIVGLTGNDQLNIRSRIWGDVVAKTWNGAQFPVEDHGHDGLGRTWFQLGSGIWVASWYTQPVD